MFEEQKYKLHPVTTIITALKSIKDLIIPLVILILANGSQFNFDIHSKTFFKDSFSLIIFSVLFIWLLSNGILKWLTFRYWFKDNELRVEYGLFIKKKRYIPFERIQNLNYKESIFHRIFGLVQVFVETAGNSSGKAEVELTAITRKAADQIEVEMRKAKSGVVEEIAGEVPSNEIYKMPIRHLLIVAATSNSMGVVLVGFLAFVSQFAEYIPFEKIFNELASVMRFGFVFGLFLAIIVLLIVWFISVFITAINYASFTIMQEEDRIIITRGLFEKKRITLPIKRVQAIKVVENPLREMLGFCHVVVESAGSSFSNEKDKKIILLPILAKKNLHPLLHQLFPSYVFDEVSYTHSPKRAQSFFYRLNFFYIVPVVAVVSYWLYPYGLLSLVAIVLMVLLGIWQHRTAAVTTVAQQLIIRYRVISRVTFYVQRSRIQMMEQQQSYFQQKRQIATAKVVVMSGLEGASAKASNMEEEKVVQLLQWYEMKK